MRIAQLAPPWLRVPPTGYGGIEQIVASLCDGLVERDHDVTLFATGDSSTRAVLRSCLPRASGTASIGTAERDVLHTLFAFRDIEAFDIVHVHSRYAAIVASAFVDVPVIHTIHWALDRDLQRIYSMLGPNAELVALSEAQRRTAPALPISRVVPNGIDLARYPFRAEKDDFLLFLGRAAPEKGLLEAVRAARAAGSRLVIALKDPQSDERSFWERKVVPELGPDTIVWGELSFEVKADLLSRARAVLFPIDWDEPFGLVMIEAMACGTPVIATDRAAVPEIVDDGATGFIVPARSFVAHAAEAVRALVSIDPEACRRRVERDFTAARMVDSYADLYRSTLTRVRGGASSTSSA